MHTIRRNQEGACFATKDPRVAISGNQTARPKLTLGLTKFKHPWTNGQVERMNRTIKDATVRRFYYETHESLRAHLATFLDAYNFAKRLKSLRGLTPVERICQL